MGCPAPSLWAFSGRKADLVWQEVTHTPKHPGVQEAQGGTGNVCGLVHSREVSGVEFPGPM